MKKQEAQARLIAADHEVYAYGKVLTDLAELFNTEGMTMERFYQEACARVGARKQDAWDRAATYSKLAHFGR